MIWQFKIVSCFGHLSEVFLFYFMSSPPMTLGIYFGHLADFRFPIPRSLNHSCQCISSIFPLLSSLPPDEGVKGWAKESGEREGGVVFQWIFETVSKPPVDHETMVRPGRWSALIGRITRGTWAVLQFCLTADMKRSRHARFLDFCCLCFELWAWLSWSLTGI